MHRFERCQSTESIWEEPERGTFFGTTLRSTQQPMRRISWAASLCLPLPVDNNPRLVTESLFERNYLESPKGTVPKTNVVLLSRILLQKRASNGQIIM